ncbi:MAG: hypothetical protein J6L69_02035 [Lachnospiraceae bacterium]|nr:hypothetical protein [Lachnospiraceae bacterium]
MMKKLFTMMLIVALAITSLFACSKDEASDSKESKKESDGGKTSNEKSEEDIEWIEVEFKDLYTEKGTVDGEEKVIYELYAQFDGVKEMFLLSEEQYETLWYYCYGLTTDSDNDFHLYIAYDAAKDADTTEKGTVTDYKIVNNNETVSVNGDVDEAKKYFINECDLFEVGEGNFIMSIYNEMYENLDSENAYIMYTCYWYEDNDSVDMDSLSENKRVVSTVTIYKKDNEELFNQLVGYSEKRIDYIKCKAKCDVSVIRVFGNPSNEFEIIEIGEVVEKDY